MDFNTPLWTPNTTPQEPIIPSFEKQLTTSPEMDLGIPDDEFVQIIDGRIQASKSYYDSKLRLYERQKRNELFYLGQQISEAKLKPYQVGYTDNVIYEAIASIIPIAMSRLPDLIVKPGEDTPEQKQSAELLTKILNSDIRKEQNREVLEMALKHLFIYYFGVIKYRWDKTITDKGDYVFEYVLPTNIILDHTATSPNPNKMQYIAQHMEKSVRELIIDFPNKEGEILAELVESGAMKSGSYPSEQQLDSKIRYTEIWFSWLKKKSTGESERIEGVAWKYRKTLLGKMKNPYYDFVGEDTVTDMEGNEIEPLDGVNRMMMGEDIKTDKVFNNYFLSPRKPYIILTFDRIGRHAFDDTSIVEQVIKLQQNVNKRGLQITDMNDKARGKDIFNASVFEKKDVEEASMYDPSTDLFVNMPSNMSVGDIYAHVAGEMPNAAVFQELANTRDRVFSKMGVNSTTRGIVTPDSTATEAQLARESDFGRIDYLVETTVNYAAAEMARASMQMVKLMYEDEHFVRLVGEKGQMLHLRLSRDEIKDGMEVEVGASGTDKIMRKSQALQLAKLGVIDPLTLYEELMIADPVGKVKRLMTFQTNPAQYMLELGSDGEDTIATEAMNLIAQSQGQPIPTAPDQQAPQIAQQEAIAPPPMPVPPTNL